MGIKMFHGYERQHASMPEMTYGTVRVRAIIIITANTARIMIPLGIEIIFLCHDYPL
jgi:hypothetical protein